MKLQCEEVTERASRGLCTRTSTAKVFIAVYVQKVHVDCSYVQCGRMGFFSSWQNNGGVQNTF